jgi:hypothetical protein
MERTITDLIKQKGPLTGAELHTALGGDPYLLWKACMKASRLTTRIVGKRFLRLDQKVSGFARLSPSIMREFLTYSVIGLTEDTEGLERRAHEILAHIQQVSRNKRELARNIVSVLAGQLVHRGIGIDDLCVLIAGDIVYDMAHDVPRPERSTGKMIRGSDLDLVFLLDDRVPDAAAQGLDEIVYREKYRYLINPLMREEIDYIVKKLERVREQAAFDTFKRMIACKILHEGELLYGSAILLQAAKSMLEAYGATEKLARMQQEAWSFRAKAEEYLLGGHQDRIADEDRHLFYTAEESEEFE